MRIEFTEGVGELIELIPEIKGLNWRDGTADSVGWSPSFQLHPHGDLLLVWKEFKDDLQSYRVRNCIDSTARAAMEIELRENRVEVVSSLEVPRVSSIEQVLVRTLQSFPLIANSLTKAFGNCGWVMWANIQFHLGEFEEGVEDSLKARAADLVQNKRNWWFMVDVSFAKSRPGVSDLIKERFAGRWGDTHSPLQIVCYL